MTNYWFTVHLLSHSKCRNHRSPTGSLYLFTLIGDVGVIDDPLLVHCMYICFLIGDVEIIDDQLLVYCTFVVSIGDV